MLEHKMTVEQNRLNFGKERVIAINMRPASLHHANFWVGEVVNYTFQKILGWHEIRIEDGYKFASRCLETLRQRARLEPFAIRTMMVADRESLGSVMIN